VRGTELPHLSTASFVQSARKTAIARHLRKQETWAEKLMWCWLRDRRFSAYKFRRQFPLGAYVLDFFCVEARLNIELDGFQHGFPQSRASDALRDTWLTNQGILVLRFWNSRLRREKQAIRNLIWRALQERAPHPLPDHCRPGLCSSCQPKSRN
jgi:very-short-patch-repair endonuclease